MAMRIMPTTPEPALTSRSKRTAYAYRTSESPSHSASACSSALTAAVMARVNRTSWCTALTCSTEAFRSASGVDLADEPVVVQHREREVPPASLFLRLVHLQRVFEVEQLHGPNTVVDQPVEGRQQQRCVLRNRRRWPAGSTCHRPLVPSISAGMPTSPTIFGRATPSARSHFSSRSLCAFVGRRPPSCRLDRPARPGPTGVACLCGRLRRPRRGWQASRASG